MPPANVTATDAEFAYWVLDALKAGEACRGTLGGLRSVVQEGR